MQGVGACWTVCALGLRHGESGRPQRGGIRLSRAISSSILESSVFRSRGAGGDLFPWLSRWASRALLGDLINAHVDEDHDEAGGEEGADGGVENVPALVVELALRSHRGAGVPLVLVHGKQRRERDDG